MFLPYPFRVPNVPMMYLGIKEGALIHTNNGWHSLTQVIGKDIQQYFINAIHYICKPKLMQSSALGTLVINEITVAFSSGFSLPDL